MPFPPIDKSFEGVLRELTARLGLIERRLSRGGESRLGPDGAEVTDWNSATRAGFYWGTDALHAPTTGMFGGITMAVGGRVIQDVTNATTTTGIQGITYRRVFANSVWSAWIEAEPNRLAEAPTQTADANTMVDNGFYAIGSSTNTPISTGLGTVTVVKNGNGIHQTFQRAWADNGSSDDRRWVRASIDGGATWAPWIEQAQPVVDTGWVTTGIAFAVASGWTIMNYRLRQRDNRVFGKITLRYDGPGITTGADSNVSDITSVITVPAPWRNGSGNWIALPGVKGGTETWWFRIDTDGTIDFTHGSFAAQVMVTSDQLNIACDWTVD